MKSNRTKVVTAITLLDAYEKYVDGNSPDVPWTEEEVKDDPVALCRLRQLKAMLGAFGISAGPEKFACGGFLAGREREYEPLVELAKPLMRPQFGEGARSHQISTVFRVLRAYRHGMRRGCKSHGEFLCYSGFVAHVVEDVIFPINKQVAQLLEPVEFILSAIVNPHARTFTVGELIEKYGYQDADADEMLWQSLWLFDEEDPEEDASTEVNPDG